MIKLHKEKTIRTYIPSNIIKYNKKNHQ